MSESEPTPNGDDKAAPGDKPLDRRAGRTLGWMFVGLGLAVGCFTIGWPVYQAHAGAREISISLKWTVLPIFLIVFGIAEGIGLNVFGKMFEEGHHITSLDIVRLLALTAIGLGAEWLLKRHIESLGYYFPI